MQEKLQKSIERASSLLKTPLDYEKYISIKLSPPSGCCCSDCWPKTWRIVNEAIYPCGPIVHEGEAIIKNDCDMFVLEQHESGPEVLVYLALATPSITLVKSVIELLTTIIKGLSTENRKQPARIKIVKRQLMKGKIEEELLIEIDIPISKVNEKKLEDNIIRALIEKP